MRTLGVGLIAGLIGFGAAQNAPTAASVLEAGRRAVSGGTKVTEIRSLVVKGHRQVLIGSTGKLSAPRPIDIRILMPDRYLRTTIDGPSESRSGFAGSEVLNSIRALKPGDSFGGSWGPEQLGIERAWFARFLLGMLSHSTAAGRLDARRSSASSIELTGDNGFAAVLEFDDVTHLPVRVRHVGNVHFPVPGSTMPPPPEKAEIVWTFQDRRRVAGLLLPHRVTRTARDVTLEDMRFESIDVDAPIDAGYFRK